MNCKTRARALVALAAICSAAAAEDSWQWSPEKPYHKATVKIWQNGRYTGSGVLIGANEEKTLGYILTAAHTVSQGAYAGAEWKDQRRSAGRIILEDEALDLAIITCDPPDDAIVAEIATKLPKKGATCDHSGWGGKEPIQLRTFFGQYMHTENSGTFTNTSAIKGDSGGGVWYDGQLIGIIQGGKYRVSNGQEINFPARSSTLKAVQDLCGRLAEIPASQILQLATAAVPPNYFEFLGQDVDVQVNPDGVRVVTPRGVTVPGLPPATPPPTPVVTTPPARTTPPAPPTPQPPRPAPPIAVAQPAAPSPQVVSIDTRLIAGAVVAHIVEHDMIPPQKIDDAEMVIRIATRLRDDEEFADLVATKIMAQVERRLMNRIGKVLLDDAK